MRMRKPKAKQKKLSPIAAGFLTAAIGYGAYTEYQSQQVHLENGNDFTAMDFSDSSSSLSVEGTPDTPPVTLEQYKNGSALSGSQRVNIDLGQMAFCQTRPDFCKPYANPGAVISLTPETLGQLQFVNVLANMVIAPQDDIVTYGVPEKWVAPDIGTNYLPAQGDCEEYVLAKMQLLMTEHGYDPSVFSIVIVNDPLGRDNIVHAILGVHTDHGTLLLDNFNDDLKFPHETGYRFLYMQSYSTPEMWVKAEMDMPQKTADNVTIEQIITLGAQEQNAVPVPLPRP